jgi:hypothetical protein
MKKILLAFVGQSRTFEKTYQNIFDNFLIPYKDTYTFDIVINTEKNDDKNLDEKLRTIYNKYNQLKYIHYETLSRDTYHGSMMFGIRISKILEIEEKNKNKYDFYIFCRLDAVLLNPINLDNFINKTKLVSISGYNERPCDTHTHDWDFIWLSDYKSLLTFMYPYMELSNKYKFKSNDTDFESIYARLDEIKNRNLTIEEIKKIKLDCGLDGDTSYINHFKSVYLVLLNNCKFEFTNMYKLYSYIIRK